MLITLLYSYIFIYPKKNYNQGNSFISLFIQQTYWVTIMCQSLHRCWLTADIQKKKKRICLFWLPWWLSWYSLPAVQETQVFYLWVWKIPWRRKWQPTPVFQPRESNGWINLLGYHPWGHKELDTTERLYFHFRFTALNLRMCILLSHHISLKFPFVHLLSVHLEEKLLWQEVLVNIENTHWHKFQLLT